MIYLSRTFTSSGREAAHIYRNKYVCKMLSLAELTPAYLIHVYVEPACLMAINKSFGNLFVGTQSVVVGRSIP